MTLQDEVNYLRFLKREGGYWDFKKEWYEDKAELLLDIICIFRGCFLKGTRKKICFFISNPCLLKLLL